MPYPSTPTFPGAPSPPSGPSYPSSPSFRGPVVSVAAGTSLTTIGANYVGINATAPNLYSLDAAVPAGQPSTTSLMAAINATVWRFPGGPLGQRYIWDGSNSANNPSHPYLTASYTDFLDTDSVGGHGAAGLSADTLVTQVAAAGGLCMMCVNYGTNKTNTGGGDSALAASWVTHHKTNGTLATVPLWEIGSETYWQVRTGGSDNTGLTPNAWADVASGYETGTHYGTNAAGFWTAMKAASATIQCGLVAWTEGGARSGPALTAQAGWTYNALSAFKTATGGPPDYLIIHYYPEQVGFENDWKLLAGRRADLQSIKAALDGISNALFGHTLPIDITEINTSDSTPLSRQSISIVNALYAAHVPTCALELGYRRTLWWSDHCSTIYTGGSTLNAVVGSPVDGQPLAGTAGYGTFGLLSSARTSGALSEPAVNTPYPPYWGLRLSALMAGSGDTLVSASSSDEDVVLCHAAHRADGTLAVMVLSRDPSAPQQVQISVSGFTLGASGGAAGTATDYTYDQTLGGVATTARQGLSGTDTVTLPPYGMLVRVYA